MRECSELHLKTQGSGMLSGPLAFSRFMDIGILCTQPYKIFGKDHRIPDGRGGKKAEVVYSGMK